MKERSSLLPFLEAIRSLKAAEPRIDCVDIRTRLGLLVQPEQVRRFCHRHGIPVNPAHTKFGAKNHAWRGGRTVDKSGYVLLYRPEHPDANASGYVREHRLVMAELRGRPLLPAEVVHHLNDDRADNKPENLRLYAANRDHLADTLKGRCPKWTPEGRARILEGVRRGNRHPRATTSHPSLESDVDPLQESGDLTES